MAVEWYTKAAEQGHIGAQRTLGYSYYCGDCIPQDYEKAYHWYSEAAAAQRNPGLNSNYSAPLFNLGRLHEEGRGVSQNYQEAIKWYTMAAERGNSMAQLNLGLMYAQGRGLAINESTAIEWFTKAAEQGYPKAQQELGLLYHRATNVPRDYKQAYAWLSVAALSGDLDNRRERDACASELSPEAFLEAQSLAVALQAQMGPLWWPEG